MTSMNTTSTTSTLDRRKHESGENSAILDPILVKCFSCSQEKIQDMSGTKDLNIAFSGCGFLGIYHLGVVSCFKDNAPAFLERVKCFGGTSAGAFAATALLMDLNMSESAEFVLRLAKRANSLTLGPLHPQFRIVNTVTKSFQKILPENAHEIASGRLNISLTRVPDFKNIIVSEFSSKQDLIDALLATSHVPFYSSILPAKFRGVYYVDGGLTDNLPQHFDGETITVSPFSGESDICPRDGSPNLAYIDLRNTSVQFTLQNLYRCSRAFFPPDMDTLIEMCKQGYRDTMRFLQIHYPETLTSEAHRKKPSSVFSPFGQLSNSALTSQMKVSRRSRISSISSESVYSTCSNTDGEIYYSEQDGQADDEADDIATDGESRLSLMLDKANQSISEKELWSCYFIRKAVWVFRMAAKPCVLSAKQISYMANMIVDYLPVIEKTGIEFMDHLLAMIYVMIHTYKNKHQVHHRKHGVVVRYQRPLTKTQAALQEASIELVQKWRLETSHRDHMPTSPCLSSSDSTEETSDIEIIHDESFGSGGYDMCDSISFHTMVSEEQLELTLGVWESEGGACHSTRCVSGGSSEDYIVLDGYETDVESIMSSDAGDEPATSLESSL